MKDWSRERVDLMCEMCGERRPDVLRFGLIRRLSRERTTHGAGGISLCRRCWQGLNCHRQRRAAA